MIEPAYCLLCGIHLNITIYEDGHPHPVCPGCGWVYFPDPKVAAAVHLIRDDRVLLVRRIFDPHRGEWTLPAGYVNAGEDPAEAAARECLEETGVSARITGLRLVITGREHPRGADIVLVYNAEYISGDVCADDDADEAGFFPLNALPPLAFRATRSALGIEEA